MKVMRIGSSLINLEGFNAIEARHCDDGVILRVEHDHSINEYLVPGEIDPELVSAVVMDCLNHYANFDLPLKLKARSAMISYEEEDE